MLSQVNMQLVISIELNKNATSDDLDQAACQLLQNIKDLDVDSVGIGKSGSPPDGSMAVEPLTAGLLLLAIAPSVLPALIELIRIWKEHKPEGRVKIRFKDLEFELDSNLSDEKIREIVERFQHMHKKLLDE